MRPSTRLSRLKGSACRRIGRLRTLGNAAIVGRLPRQQAKMNLAFSCTEALATWTNFVRSYYLSLCMGTRTSRGQPIAVQTSFGTLNDALGFAVRFFNPRKQPNQAGVWDRRDEPPWHDPNTLMRLGYGLAFGNLADIQSTFSLGMTVTRNLPAFRNWFAHRNQYTQAAAQKLAPLYGIPATLRPEDILCMIPLGRPQALLLDWLDEIEILVDFLCG